jgi:hypothetical protein
MLMTEAPTAAPRGQSDRQGVEGDRQAIRMVAEALDLLRPTGARLRVLDVTGSQSLGDALSNDDVTVADAGELKRLAHVGAQESRLSAGDGSFDFVVGVDAYARVESGARERYLAELRRVARRGVLIAAPFDSPALGGALRVAGELRGHLDQNENGGPVERLDEGLPSLDGTREVFERTGDKVLVVGDGQLALWLFATCMPLYGSGLDDRFIDLADRLGSLWEELLAGRNGGPSYRHLMVSLRSAEEGDLAPLAPPTPGAGTEALSSGLMATMAAILPLGAELQALQRRLGEYERRLGVREGALARRDAQVKDLSRRLADAITLVEAEREEKDGLQRQLDGVVNTRAWRAIALQHRVRHWLAAKLAAPFKAIGRLFRRNSGQA